jgi:hypothetical protein
LYNSAELSAVALGAPGGVVAPRNEMPVEPPTISTWPSIEVPLPTGIRVAVGPLRAIVILPEVNVNDCVLSSYSSAVFSVRHRKEPIAPPYSDGPQSSPPTIRVFPLGSATAAADSRAVLRLPTFTNVSVLVSKI